jgi:hypothetical protein
MKPILIHYPYAINREHQQLQTSIKGGATPRKSLPNNFIKNIRLQYNSVSWPNQVSHLTNFYNRRQATCLLQYMCTLAQEECSPSPQYEEIISSNSDSRCATSRSMKQPPSYLQCAIPQVCHRNKYTPVSSIHVLPMIIDQSAPMCQKWLSLGSTHAQVLPPRHHHRCNSITPKCLISILHIKSLFQAMPIHVL